MGIVNINNVKAGMELEQAIISPDNGQCLLKAGSILNLKNIEKLKELNITHVGIKDINSLFISPSDKMQKMLVTDYIAKLRETAPKNPEANKNDNIVIIASNLEKFIVQIAKSEYVLDFLVQLRIIDKARLYDASIYTAVLSGLVAGAMKLSNEEIIAAVIGGLLHDIGLAEMPSLVKMDEFTPQQEKLW